MQLRTVALLLSVVSGALAVVWPVLPWRLLHNSGQSCPLGFGGGDGIASPHFTEHHGHSSILSQQQQKLVLYTNGTVWTGMRDVPHTQAFAVDQVSRRFTYVGSSAGAPAAAEVVDLQGAHVIPGLIDSHLHLIGGGLSLSRLDLSSAASEEQLIAAVAAAAANVSAGGWLLGGSWDESRWGGQLPTAAWIDPVTRDTPTWLVRLDYHMGLANSAALRLAGIGPGTPDPPGGSIHRGADGHPGGLLTDSAMQLLAAHIPPLSLDERRRALEAAVQHAVSKGITLVHCMGRVAFMEGEEAAWEDLEELYTPAAHAGALPLRIYAFVPLSTWRRMAERVRQLGTAHPGGMLFWGGVKEFADGSLGSRTALFHEPYTDQPGTCGTRTVPLEQLREMVAAADAAGLQVAVHAIGDRAVDDVLGIYAELAAHRSTGGSAHRDGGSSGSGASSRPLRHRIEHAQHLSDPGVADKLAAAGVIVTPNPLHLLADMPVLEGRLGRQRAGAGRTYALRTLLQAGVTAALGSDWPVVPLEPLSGTLHAAVHRRVLPGMPSSAPWSPEEAVSVAEALAAHTLAGAEAAGLERDLGSVSVGKLADFVVLGDGTPLDAVPLVRSTFLSGKCVFGC